MKSNKRWQAYVRPNPCVAVAFGLIMLTLLPASPLAAQSSAGRNTVASQSQRKLTGRVLDTAGEPLIGATVSVVGQNGGTITDLDGNFVLMLPAGVRQVKVSYIGYKDQTLDVSGQSVLSVKLNEDNELLQEVVVVGYGAQKKATLTGAVTIVSDKMIESKGSLSSPLQAIQGQVPGVSITRGSSAPGDESWNMKLRGSVSANTADPLIVIDGVAYDGVNALRNINPSDIQSMNFLKDASAAIYGSRAAGGVVLITTKQAKEGKTKVEYNGSYTHKMVGLQPKLMSMEQWADALITARTNDGYTDSDTWMQYAKLALANKGGYIDLKHSSNPFTSAFTDVQDFVFQDTNWTDILFGDAGSTTHDLAVSGGTAKALYRLSLGYLYDDSNLKWGKNNNNRYNIRLSNTFKPFQNFKIESMIAYNRQDQVSPSQLGSTLTSTYPQPGLPAATLDGRPYSWGTWMSPIWFAELGGDNQLKVSEFNISEKLMYNITKDLDAVVNLGYNSSSATRDSKKMAITSYNYAGTSINGGPAISDPTKSSYEKTSSRTDFYSMSGYLHYHKTFAQHHNFGAMLGVQYEMKEYDHFGASALNIQNSLDVINGAGTISLKDNRGTKWQEAVMSYYSRLNYNYRERYLLEVNLRYDGSSKFQPRNRWDFFYGVSGGWRITQEEFMQPASGWLNDLKLRLSYGEVGNQNGIARYDGAQFYNFSSQSGALIGSDKATIINTNGEIASVGRQWERIKTANIGLDFSLLDSRLSGTVELFQKRNDNMLITVTYPGILGDGAGKSNSGKFEAWGWEGIVNWSDKIGEWTYRVGGTFSYVNNKLTDIGGTKVLRQGFVGQQQDFPLNSVFGLRYAGKVQNEEQRQKYLYRFLSSNTVGLTNELRLGDNMYEDVNQDGRLDQEDFVYLGTDDPKVNYSFNLGVEWKGFDLSFIFQGVGQRTVWRDGDNGSNATWRVPMRSAYLNTSNQSVGNVWSPQTPNNHFPTYTNKSTINDYNYQASSWSVEDGSYLRLKNVTLGYNFSSSLLKRTKVISGCRLYVSGADLWEISNINDGWDPESSRNVKDTGRFPFVRTVTVGMNLTF